MRYAKIENQVVVNIVLSDEVFAVEHGLISIPTDVEIGHIYDGQKFHPPLNPHEEPSWIDKRVFGYKDQAGYPTVGSFLNDLYDAMAAGLLPKVEPWYGSCTAIKTAFPKSEIHAS